MRTLFALLLFFPFAPQADVYQCEKDGAPLFQDFPCDSSPEKKFSDSWITGGSKRPYTPKQAAERRPAKAYPSTASPSSSHRMSATRNRVHSKTANRLKGLGVVIKDWREWSLIELLELETEYNPGIQKLR